MQWEVIISPNPNCTPNPNPTFHDNARNRDPIPSCQLIAEPKMPGLCEREGGLETRAEFNQGYNN